MSRLGPPLVAVLVASCGNETARAPVPTAYDWPDSLAYRVDEVAQAPANSQGPVRRESSRVLRFVMGYDGIYSIRQDSVRLGVAPRSGAPAAATPSSDTLRYFVRLSRWGEFLSLVPACDPAVPACGDAPRSEFVMRLRSIVPKLPVWWPPKGHPWEDTLDVNAWNRARGPAGTVVMRYRVARDTVVGAVGYWVVAWTSLRPSSTGSPDSGVVYVDQRRMIPALAVWGGTRPPGPGDQGAAVTRVSGRAVLVGSGFDSLRVPEEAK